MTRRFLILAEGNFGPQSSKTANACIRYAPSDVVAVLDSTRAGQTAQQVLGFGGDIPVVATFADALSRRPNALLIGIAAGALSVIGYSIIAPKLQQLIRGTDTCGINNLHGMPGILGGLMAIFITGHAAIQLLGIVATVCIAFLFGKATGSIIGLLGKKEMPYSDEDEFFLAE